MTGQIEISARAGTISLVAAGPGGGCAGRRDLGRSCHWGKLCERRRKKRIQTPKEEEFRTLSMNVGTMRGRGAEIVETATRRRLDCGFLQETKLKDVLCPSQSRSEVRWLKGKDSVYKVFWHKRQRSGLTKFLKSNALVTGLSYSSLSSGRQSILLSMCTLPNKAGLKQRRTVLWPTECGRSQDTS